MSYAAEIARSVRRYEPECKPALRAFQRTYFGAGTRHSDDEFAAWLFDRNPHRAPGGPALWLCVRDGVVVGQQASIPIVLKVGDREQRAAWMIDWMIDPGWRLKGVAPALLNTSMNEYELMLGLGLEDAAYKTVARAGWQDIGRLALFVRPLDPEACGQMLNVPPIAARLVPRIALAGTATAAAAIAGALTRISIDPVSAFDERIDAIWRAAANEHEIMVKRDFAMVHWRYDDGPSASRYQRFYVRHRGETVGYAVVRLAKARGQPVGRVVDYLVPRRWTAALYAFLIDVFAGQRAAAVFFEHWDPGSEPLLRTLGCVRVRQSHRFMFRLRDPRSPLANALPDARRWFVVPGDSDFDHVLIGNEGDAADPVR